MTLFAGRYELGPVIGRGGMAEVREAVDTRLDRPVAVKVMHRELAHQTLIRDRFESEARMAARLVHPNVVSVFDSGEDGGLPFIVMERLPGETLHDRLGGAPMPEAEVRQMAAEVLAGLGTAHSAGILHRDVKPANVLAAPGGHWKVGDFGIAKALEVDHGDATATGIVLGTPAYLAPERLLGAPATVASDMYSLCVVLYEALAGRKPYPGAGPNSWPASVTGPAPVPLAALRPGIDPALAGAVARGLQREPSERFWSAEEMAAAIGAGDGWGSAAAVPTAALGTAGWGGAAHTGPARTEVLTTPLRSAPRRRPASVFLVGLAAAAGLAAVILVGVAAGTGGGSHATPPSVTTTVTAPPTTPPTTPATTAPTLPKAKPAHSGPGEDTQGGDGGPGGHH